MFLITTADRRFWKTDRPVLFLGEWCKLFSERSVWTKLQYEVLPYHWDDRKKLYQDYLYLDKLYEQILSKLKDSLNKIHGVHHSVRYWRIIIGPWLYWFIQSFYDRYQTILAAAESGKVTDTLIGKNDAGEWVPKNMTEFVRMSESDEYNHYLYSCIIEHFDRIPFNSLEVTKHCHEPVENGFRVKLEPRLFKNALIHLSRLCDKFISNRFSKIVFVSTNLSKWDMIKLQFSLFQFPSFFPPNVISPESKIDMGLRGKIYFELSGNDFEELLGIMIKKQIPSVYVEGYSRMCLISQHAFPRRPKVVFTASALFQNEGFKFWAAHHADNGVKFVGTQYGGHYGTGLWSAKDDHLIKIYDKFYTWGWKAEGIESTQPLPAAQLNKIKARPKKEGKLLLVLAAMPRYSYYMYSAFVATTGYMVYLNEQYRFIRGLTEKNKRSILVRPYLHDYGYQQAERWQHEFPDIEYCFGNKPMVDQLNESRLFIGTYNATTYLETFVANFPTVLFWNPDHWELNSAAQPYFDGLRAAGILHDNAESAAAKVNEIFHNPLSWWQQSEVQAAKDEFCRQFAYTSKSWLNIWRNELSHL